MGKCIMLTFIKLLIKFEVITIFYCSQFNEQKFVQEFGLIFDQNLPVLKKLHLNTLKIINGQAHDLNVAVCHGTKLSLQLIFPGVPIVNLQPLIFVGTSYDVDYAEAIALTDRDILLVVVLRQHKAA
jgi:hypothetical protein